MKKMNRVLIALIAVAMFVIPIGIASAASVANGELKFHGGQTGTEVYSNILDAKPDNSKYYKVYASVKVCGNTYASGWKNDKASISHDREWYCNESAYYDYYRR